MSNIHSQIIVHRDIPGLEHTTEDANCSCAPIAVDIDPLEHKTTDDIEVEIDRKLAARQ